MRQSLSYSLLHPTWNIDAKLPNDRGINPLDHTHEGIHQHGDQKEGRRSTLSYSYMPSARRYIRERNTFIHSRLLRQAKHAFCNDIGHDLIGTTGDTRPGAPI